MCASCNYNPKVSNHLSAVIGLITKFIIWGHICAKLHLPFSALIFPRALKACSKIFGSLLSRFDKMLVINPAFTQGTLVSSKNKN